MANERLPGVAVGIDETGESKAIRPVDLNGIEGSKVWGDRGDFAIFYKDVPRAEVLDGGILGEDPGSADNVTDR